MMLELSKVWVMIQNKVKPFVVLAYGLAGLFAIYCFAQSQDAQSRLDRDDFVLWHNLWHM
jgi:hypothetical protein